MDSNLTDRKRLDCRLDDDRPSFTGPVFVTWNQRWTVEHFIDAYLAERRLPVDEARRQVVWECLQGYRCLGMLRKSDLEFYLDKNLGEIEVPGEMAKAEVGRAFLFP